MASGKENPFNGWKLGKDDDLTGIEEPRPAEKKAREFAGIINYTIFPRIMSLLGDYANVCVNADATQYDKQDFCHRTDVKLTRARVHVIPITITYLRWGEDKADKLVALCVEVSKLYGCEKHIAGSRQLDKTTEIMTRTHCFLFDDKPMSDSIISKWLQQRNILKLLSQF